MAIKPGAHGCNSLSMWAKGSPRPSPSSAGSVVLACGSSQGAVTPGDLLFKCFQILTHFSEEKKVVLLRSVTSGDTGGRPQGSETLKPGGHPLAPQPFLGKRVSAS